MYHLQNGGNTMSIEIKKIELTLASISELCEKTTTGNLAHKIATIKHQVEYAMEQLDQILKNENNTGSKCDIIINIESLMKDVTLKTDLDIIHHKELIIDKLINIINQANIN